MDAKHTPGPWLRIDTADYAEIHAAFRPSSQAVALVGKPVDADLVAACPELLAFAQAYIDRIDDGSPVDTSFMVQLARQCIAKATSETSS